MSADVFETFYVSDWGSEHNARKARDHRRLTVIRTEGASAVCRGTVHHPAFGPGFELWYVRASDRTDDVRITPRERWPQLPPRLVAHEERFEGAPW